MKLVKIKELFSNNLKSSLLAISLWLSLLIIVHSFFPLYTVSALFYLFLIPLIFTILSLPQKQKIQISHTDKLFLLLLLYIPLSNTVLPKLIRHSLRVFISAPYVQLFHPEFVLIIYLFYTVVKELTIKGIYEILITKRFIFYGWHLLLTGSLISIGNTEYVAESLMAFLSLLILFLFYCVLIIKLKRKIISSLALSCFTYSLIILVSIPTLFLILDQPFPILATDFLAIKMNIPFMKLLGSLSLGNSGHMATILTSVSLFFATHLAIKNDNESKKGIFIFVLCLSLFYTLVSYSRISLLVLIMFFVFIFLFQLSKKRFSKESFLAIFWIVAIHFSFNLRGYYWSTLSPKTLSHYDTETYAEKNNIKTDRSASLRLAAMGKGWELIQKSPIVGKGTGTYPFYEKVYTSPHFFPFTVWFENGLLGLIGLICLLIGTINSFFDSWFSKKHDDLNKAPSLGALSLLLMCILTGSTLIMDNILITGSVLCYFICANSAPSKTSL